jgi:hypothetical protein
MAAQAASPRWISIIFRSVGRFDKSYNLTSSHIVAPSIDGPVRLNPDVQPGIAA